LNREVIYTSDNISLCRPVGDIRLETSKQILISF